MAQLHEGQLELAHKATSTQREAPKHLVNKSPHAKDLREHFKCKTKEKS